MARDQSRQRRALLGILRQVTCGLLGRAALERQGTEAPRGLRALVWPEQHVHLHPSSLWLHLIFHITARQAQGWSFSISSAFELPPSAIFLTTTGRVAMLLGDSVLKIPWRKLYFKKVRISLNKYMFNFLCLVAFRRQSVIDSKSVFRVLTGHLLTSKCHQLSKVWPQTFFAFLLFFVFS